MIRRRRPHRLCPVGPTRVLVLGAALTVVGLVGGTGCSGDETTSASTTTTTPATSSTSTSTSTTAPADPERAAYVALVNPLCVERNDRIEAAAVGTTVPEIAAALAKRARFSIETNQQIRALSPPPGDEDEVAALLAAMDEIDQDTATLAEAVLVMDAATGRAVALALQEKLPALNAQLVAFGLGDCVLEPPTS